MRVTNEESSRQEARGCVNHDCVFSPELFYLYRAFIMRDFMNLDGIKCDGRSIDNIRYADETALVKDSEQRLQTLVQALVRSI